MIYWLQYGIIIKKNLINTTESQYEADIFIWYDDTVVFVDKLVTNTFIPTTKIMLAQFEKIFLFCPNFSFIYRR